MADIKDGGPAFPIMTMPGTSLQDWFAGMAMQAIITGGTKLTGPEIAALAYRTADAMLAERKRRP